VSATFESVDVAESLRQRIELGPQLADRVYGPGQIGNVDLQGLGWLQSIGHFSQMRSHGFGELN
jgi:hypothetical protein